MGIMDNFKQAVNELTGQEEQGGEQEKELEPSPPVFQQRPVDNSIDVMLDDDESVEEVSTGHDTEGEGIRVMDNARSDFTSRFSQSLDFVSKTPPVSTSGTVIASGTVIDGNISSNEDLMIYGVVNGDVLNARKLIIHGEVAGSISATDISLVDSLISGNVLAENSIEMTKDSCILGDLTTMNVVVNGKVRGNIEASGSGVFKKESIVLGNISVGTIIIEGGAKMRGFVTTTDGDQEVDEDLFPKK